VLFDEEDSDVLGFQFSFGDTPADAQDEVFTVGFDEHLPASCLRNIDKQIAQFGLEGRVKVDLWLLYNHAIVLRPKQGVGDYRQ
jgi:hypothetical protein